MALITRIAVLPPATLILVSSIFCHGGDGEQDIPRRRDDPPDSLRVVSQLARYDLGNKNARTLRLSSKLSEISGLAVTSDGRLLCHDDEVAVVYELDYRDGTILKRFTVGSGFMEEDFEGIAVKEDTLFLVNSSGDLFEFHETEDLGHSDFRLFRTFLSERNDVEGLEYDPETDCLLLACKAYPGKGLKEYKAIYAFDLATRTLKEEPRFLIPLEVVGPNARKGKFNPSGIAIHPSGETFFVISADGRLIVELDRSGRVIAQQEISGKASPQPEGIAFTKDNILILASDGQGERGTITIYPQEDK